MRGYCRGKLPGDDGTGRGSHGDAVERLSHAAHVREAAVTGEVIRASRKAVEEDGGESPE